MTDSVTADVALAARDIVKRYGRSTALAGVDLDLRYGRVHALLGANGSGKSTMVKVLTGVVAPDEGSRLTVDGVPVGEWNVQRAKESGIRVLHQDAPLNGGLTVMELAGIRTGFPTRGGFIRWKALADRTQEALDRVGVTVSAKALAGSLRAPQRVEVGLALMLAESAAEARIVVLDEPTSPLSDSEAAGFLEHARTVADAGAAVLLVTHRLSEVEAFADDITVLNSGAVALAGTPDTVTTERIIAAMSGTDDPATGHEQVALPASVRSRLDDAPPPGTIQLDQVTADDLLDVSLVIEPGEILGVVTDSDAESGQLGLLLSGWLEPRRGRITVAGTGHDWRLLRDLAAYVPGERLRDGGIEALSVRENMALFGYDRYWGRRAAETADLTDLYDLFDIQPRLPARLLGALSGGNQQKAVVAKWLLSGRRIFILDNPTVGIDPLARARIFAVLRDLAAQGCIVVVISNDVAQVTQVADRVVVFRDGAIIAEVAGDAVTETNVRAATLAERSPEAREVNHR